MAIAGAGVGTGAATETSGADLAPLCPGSVAANAILVAGVFWEGTTTTPSTPSGWTLLDGPRVIESTIARMWIFGKIADGTEDGAAISFGSPAVTTQRGAYIYSMSGYVSGTITDVVTGFAFLSHATDPQMPTVTVDTDGMAWAFAAQNDNNAMADPAGESGANWVEANVEFTAALTPGLSLDWFQTVENGPFTISGGSISTANDPCGVIAFQVRPSAVAAGQPALRRMGGVPGLTPGHATDFRSW